MQSHPVAFMQLHNRQTLQVRDMRQLYTVVMDIVVMVTNSGSSHHSVIYEEPKEVLSHDSQLISHDSHIIEVRLLKAVDKGLGMNIAASPGAVQGCKVMVDEIIKGGAAHLDGSLQKGTGGRRDLDYDASHL